MNVLRSGLFALLAFTVFASGVVEVWSESTLELGTAVLLIIWVVSFLRLPRADIKWNPLMWPLIGLVALAALQILFRLSAYSYLTKAEMLKLLAYLILCFLFTQAFRERRHLIQLYGFLILLGFSVALLGIIQHFTSTGEIFWFRRPVSGGDVFGPFVNRNHFAGYMELVAPLGMALLVFRGVRRELVALVGLLTILPIGALILSGSRAGILSFAFEIIVLFFLARRRMFHAAGSTPIISIAVVALLALALIAWLGVSGTIERFGGLASKDVSVGRRISMACGALHIFAAHPLLGTGIGTLVAVYPLYETAYDGRLVDHIHDDYLELLADGGVAGGLCGLAFLWILFRCARQNFVADQSHFSLALHAGAIVALSGLLLHSLADFNLHIPSNAILFLLQACIATSLPLPPEHPAIRAHSKFGNSVRESALHQDRQPI